MKIYKHLEQGSTEWHQARCGLITASQIKNLMTPTTQSYAKNDKSRTLLFDLAAQRITGMVPAEIYSTHTDRGKLDEPIARDIYHWEYAPVDEVGFITNDKWGFTLGYSPDGLVGDDGAIEIKSRDPKYQLQTIIGGVVPDEHVLQVQGAMLIGERAWIDYVSYCAGMPMVVMKVTPDLELQNKILDVLKKAEDEIQTLIRLYKSRIEDGNMRLTATQRREGDIVA